MEPGVTASRILLPATGCPAIPAPGSTARAVGGEQEAPGQEIASPDSFDRSDPRRAVGGHTADTASVSYQAPALGLQRFWHPDQQQCRVPRCARKAATQRERITVRGLNRNHNHDLKNLLKGAAICGHQARSLADFYAARGEGYAARHGPSDPGTEDCHHHFNHMEERSELRRQTSETTNSLSVSERVLSIRGFLWRWPSGSRDALVREKSQL